MSEEKKDPNENREGYELFEGRWREVKNSNRSDWWRFNDHYDRQGYCDNPGRGY